MLRRNATASQMASTSRKAARLSLRIVAAVLLMGCTPETSYGFSILSAMYKQTKLGFEVTAYVELSIMARFLTVSDNGFIIDLC